MAGREKKPAVLKKQMLSPVSSKEGDAVVDSAVTKLNVVKLESPKLETATQPEPTPPIVKQVKKTKPKKTIKKNLKINFKAKSKKSKKIKLSKSIFKNSKLNLDTKNITLIKNGIKTKRKPKHKTQVTGDNQVATDNNTSESEPPVLEPMIAAESEDSCTMVKKEPKKRTKKIGTADEVAALSTAATCVETAETIDCAEKKQKLDAAEIAAKETVEDVLNDVANELKLDIDSLMKKPTKKKTVKKGKMDIVPKPEELPKPKKASPKKTKAETAKLRKAVKNETLIETFCKDITLDPAAQNVINNLDLNVNKTTRKKAVKKRRHSIEKIPAVQENPNDAAFEQPFVLFTNTRRSASPKSKRTSRIRQSIENAVQKRFSPYTRSDSPARILRNGKHRKLKDCQLLDGLDSEYKKRRRLCSEYSGSEISKCSGYLSESDSSYSDLASVQENGGNDTDSPPKEELTKSDLLKKEILESIKSQTSTSPEVSEIQNLNIKQISTKFTAILKRSLSTETSQISESLLNDDVKPKLEISANSFTDTNSNDVKLAEIKSESIGVNAIDADVKTEDMKCDTNTLMKVEKLDEDQQKIADKIASSPSEKVPEKSLILDQMKQTFNDFTEESERRATRSSRRHLKLDEEKTETVSTAKFYGTDTKVEHVSETVTELEASSQLEETSENQAEVNEDHENTEIEETEACAEENDKSTEANIEDKEQMGEMEDVDMTCGDEENNEEMNGQSELNIEDDLLTRLKGNSAISIVAVNEKNETMPLSMELNGDAEDMNKNNVDNSEKNDSTAIIEETPEEQAIKENILSALGLQSLKAAEEAKKQKTQVKPDVYTGTLKTVIKLNRQAERKKRNPLKMTLQKSKRNWKEGDADNGKSDGGGGKSDGENSCYKVMKESGSSSGWRQGSHSSDTADGSSEHASDGDVPATDGETSGAKALVIPEKASSFSIHPDRLCSDECAYCFGKFGLFDTPLHIAQIKSVERQNKILENEIYLMRDSCLCDACYRHVDRRLNSTSYNSSKNYKRSNVLATIPRPNHCHVLGCDRESSHVLRRKWLMKMRKSVSRVINIDLDNPGLHSIPICSEHYAAVEHLMVCALCKRRLARNHIHYLGFEWNNLNVALEKEGIPVKLTDKPVVCKLCRYFSTLLLKPAGEIKGNPASFFKEYKKRLLHFHDVELMDDAEAEEPIPVPLKDKAEKELMKKKKSKPPKNISSKNNSVTEQSSSKMDVQSAMDTDKTDQSSSRVPSNSENGESRESTPSDSMVDIETLVPNMVLECASDTEESNTSKSEVPHKALYKKLQLPESVREAVEISKILKISNTSRSNKKQNNSNNSNVVERLGSNPSISVRQLFPGEEDLPLHANIDFHHVKERTPEGWEKCACVIQYDVDTKHLWQELQKPYGNQSSFLRHLILLEKYFRNGDLTLSPNASHHAVNYSVSVQNRLRAYDNIPTNSLPMQPLTMLPFNQIKKSQSGIITTNNPVTNITSIINAANLPKNTPIPISQLNPNLLTQLSVRQKSPGVPPGLISLQPGTSRPMAPLIKMPQKFKLPVGKNWRPTLIPITTATQTKVISGGKPYHISLQDYNRMCHMKKTHDMKQQKIGDTSKLKVDAVTASVLKPIVPRRQKTTTSGGVVTGPNSKPSATSSPLLVKDTTTTAAATVDAVAIIAAARDKGKELVKTESNKNSSTTVAAGTGKAIMILPKIPKSLTVIPQTVARKPLQASSPTLSITTKPSTMVVNLLYVKLIIIFDLITAACEIFEG
ncbi:enhanced adult sensory threshold [Carabus blaptoides fortunei]